MYAMNVYMHISIHTVFAGRKNKAHGKDTAVERYGSFPFLDVY